MKNTTDTSSHIDRKPPPQKLKLPLIKVCQTLEGLFAIAIAYLKEKQIEKASDYLLRFIDAAINKFPKHPNYGDITFEYKEKLCRQTIYAVKLVKKLKNTNICKYNVSNNEI